MNFKYIFGPVPSRRLGISLGVDLVTFKTCSFDCVYCECGKTTNLTSSQSAYTDIEIIFSELREKLKSKPKLDYVTFSGSGEPTLHRDFGHVIEFFKKEFPYYKLALLTNSSTMTDPKKREEMSRLDLVVPSLDAVSQAVFQEINRPHSDTNIADIINGLVSFRKIYSGEMWLEIFIAPGINDSEDELELLHQTVGMIKPDKLQLNSLDRPGTEKWVKHLDHKRREKIAAFLGSDLIDPFSGQSPPPDEEKKIAEIILGTINRRPCTENDIIAATGLTQKVISKVITELSQSEKIKATKQERGIFYSTR